MDKILELFDIERLVAMLMALVAIVFIMSVTSCVSRNLENDSKYRLECLKAGGSMERVPNTQAGISCKLPNK